MEKTKIDSQPTDLFTSGLQEIQLSYRNKVRYADMPRVSSSKDAEDIFRHIWTHRMGYVEEFYALFINLSNRVMGWAKISMGGMNGTEAYYSFADDGQL